MCSFVDTEQRHKFSELVRAHGEGLSFANRSPDATCRSWPSRKAARRRIRPVHRKVDIQADPAPSFSAQARQSAEESAVRDPPEQTPKD